MTPAQTIALANHCRFAFETALRRLCRIVANGRISVVLSVNSGYE